MVLVWVVSVLFFHKKRDSAFLEKNQIAREKGKQSTWILKSSQILALKKRHDWYDVEMPHALSISLGRVSQEKRGDSIREAQQGALDRGWVSGSLGGE